MVRANAVSVVVVRAFDECVHVSVPSRSILGSKESVVLPVSAVSGQGLDQLLDFLVKRTKSFW